MTDWIALARQDGHRRAVRKIKLKMRFKTRLDAEIERTAEKLTLLREIKEELLDAVH